MVHARVHWLLLLTACGPSAAVAAAAADEVGSAACARCHTAIYKKYSAATMAQTSGTIGQGAFHENFDQPTVSDAKLGAEYTVSAAAEGYRLDFSRPATDVRGQRLLRWFVGSGRVARSYIFPLDGFLYQSPVSYYTFAGKWDLSPGYQQHQSIHLTRAVGTGCLQCHASRLQEISGTQNRFAAQPFLEGGIGCERCHGPGQKHLQRMNGGKGPLAIVNPAKLPPARRDSVCAQCHLTGAARIVRANRKAEDYRPGESLADYASYFVRVGPAAGAMGANSHFEKLQQSACKQASGDRLWCGSCHDAHGEPDETQKVNSYRARCQKCHQPQACKAPAEAVRQARNDCIGCHMPKARVRDTEHAVFTDHTIPRRERPPSTASASRSLDLFWKTPPDDRDLALAYAATAGPDTALRRRAFDLLRKAAERDPKDVLVLSQLAQYFDQAGDEAQAMALSERVLRLDPAQVAVAVNLGTYWIQRGRPREAMKLWADALARNPALTTVSMNLAVAQFQTSDPAAAEATLLKALDYDPDAARARALLREIRDTRR